MSENDIDKDRDLRELLSQGAVATKRATVPLLEDVLYHPFKVLDHGFVRVVDYMGDDSSIVQAARVSYGRGTKKVNQDLALINYLMRHRHTTPFEMCDIKLHVKLPIFVARQWIRHRTASVNEYSARYSILANEFYIPSHDKISPQSQINRQGRDGNAVSSDEAERIISILRDDAMRCYDHYIDMMNQDESGNFIDENRMGITRELARINLTLNYYTEWYWKINLHNLLHFVSLRADPHAQYEIRVYADVILDIIKRWVPMAYDAFVEHKLHSVSLSQTAWSVVKKMVDGVKVDQESSGLSKREWQELMSILEN